MEKQRDKAAKRQQRKLEKSAPADDQPDSADELLAEDLEPSAQPSGDTFDG